MNLPPDADATVYGSSNIVDLDAALERLGGDFDLFKDVVGFFFEDSPGLLETLKLAVAQRDANLIERTAHSLKGLMSNFGAKDAVQAAQHMETAGRNAELDGIEQSLETVLLNTGILRTSLIPYCRR